MTSSIDLDSYEEYEGDVGLGAEDKKHAKSNQLEWFKGEKGRKYRAALVYFHPIAASLVAAARAKVKRGEAAPSKEDLQKALQAALAKRAEFFEKPVDQLEPHEQLDMSSAKFKMVEAHYKENFGYVVSRLGQDGPEADLIWKSLGDVKKYFTTALLLYPTKGRDGELDREGIKNFVVAPWRISGKLYETFHTRASSLRENGLNLASQDLLLTCTNTDYQNFDVDAAGPAVWLKNKALASMVLSKAYPLYEKLQPFRVLSTADLSIKLGLSMPSGSDTSVGAEDEFKDLLNGV